MQSTHGALHVVCQQMFVRLPHLLCLTGHVTRHGIRLFTHLALSTSQSLLLGGNPQKQIRTSVLKCGTAAVLRWLRDRMQDARAQELIAARSRTQIMWKKHPSTRPANQNTTTDG